VEKNQFALTAYDSARAELIQRLHLRDNLLIVYLTVSGTFIGATLANKVGHDFLLILPFIGFGFAVLVAQHDLIVGGIGQFCAVEIGHIIQNINRNEAAVPQWDNSVSYMRMRRFVIMLRIIGQVAILVFPGVLALWLNLKYFRTYGGLMTWLWYLALGWTCATMLPGLGVNVWRLLLKRGSANRPKGS
jgi:hypothetical protein